MPSRLQIRGQFRGTIDARQPKRQKYRAWVGHPDGTIDVPERGGFVWIRTSDDKIKQALCRGAVPRYNNPVNVAYTDERENTLVILERDYERFPPNPAGDDTTFPGDAELGPHHLQHQWGGGDETYISPEQILTLGARPQATPDMTVYVEPGVYQYASGFNFWRGGNSLDMTASIPGTAGQFLFRIVYIAAATNILAYVNSSTGDDPIGFDYEALLDIIPTNCVPIAAIQLTNGMTSIEQATIFDLRNFVSSAPGTVTAGGGSGVAWGHVIIVATSGGDYTSVVSAMSAAVSGDQVWIAPGTYAENVTHKAGVYVRGMGQAGAVVIAPASGVTWTLPASGGCVLEQVTLSPPAGQVALSFPSGSTATLVVHFSKINANGAASIDASAASASASITIRDTTIDGDVNIKSATILYIPQIGGAVTQSASAGALTIYGGRIVGNLATVSGSTISLHEMPTILGTVSGAGSFVGAYLNSSGVINDITGYQINGAAASGNYLRGNGTNFVSSTIQSGDLPGGFTGFANPTASVGLTAVNGVATTAMRSDAAPALSQSITPTWTQSHIFSEGLVISASKSITLTGLGTVGQENMSVIDSSGKITQQSNVYYVGGAFNMLITPNSVWAGTSYIGGTSGGVEAIRGDSNTTVYIGGYSPAFGVSNASYVIVRTGGAQRAQFDSTGLSLANLTSGRVVTASTAGLLVDDSNLAYNTSTDVLTAGGTTDSTSTSTGTIVTAGGLGVAKAVVIGTNLAIAASINANVALVASNALRAANMIVSDANAASVPNAYSIRHNSSVTPTAGFGLSVLVEMDTTTTASSLAAFDTTIWIDPTHGSRTSRRTWNMTDSGGNREALRLEANGSAAKNGFLGASASVRQTGGENVTNNVTSGGTTGTIDNWTSLTVYATDAAAIRNAVYQLARLVKQDHDALRLYGLLT